MRVLVLNWLDRENPHAGGAEVHLHETFSRLVRRGHEVSLLCSGFEGAPAEAVLDGLRVHRTGGRHTYGLTAPVHFRRRLAEAGFDVVVEDLNKVPLFSPAWVGAPLVLLVHHLFGATAFREASLPVAAATWLLERPIPRAYGRVPTVAVSRSTAEDLVDRGLDSSRIDVIPNGVDVERYSPDPAVDRFAEPTLLYLGRLKAYKRVDLLIRAVAELERRSVPCRLLIAGRGDHAGALRRLRDRLGLSDRIELLGWVDEARKLELLRRSWIHLLTSPKEGWGIANLEAAACATPTVASDSPGLRDSVIHGETGLLVPHGDVEPLADRIQELLSSPEDRERLGRGARRFAGRHSWEATADRWEAYLHEHPWKGGRGPGNPLAP